MYLTRNDYLKLTYKEILNLGIKYLENSEKLLKITENGFTYGKWFKEPVTKDNYQQLQYSIRKLICNDEDFKNHSEDIKYHVGDLENTRYFRL